ncbi:hypothetical protein MMC13_008503 [Lambiella insularis]|nr:hypothetical protein [Lambiella insularis]
MSGPLPLSVNVQPALMSVAQLPRKRKQLPPDAGEPIHTPYKRQRTDESTRQARRAAREQYWDTLSKVWLTPRALREFDRRNTIREQEKEQKSTAKQKKIFSIDTTHLSPACLKNLKRFARRGGPSLTGIRSYPPPESLSSRTMGSHGSSSQGRKRSNQSSNTSFSGRTRESSAYDRDFEQKLIDNGISMPSRLSRPNNWEILRDAITRPRPSLSPSQFSDGAFERFCDAQEEARGEDEVVANVLPTILGDSDRAHRPAPNKPLTNLAPMAPEQFKDIKPDRYYGAPPEQIHGQVRRDLNHQIVPSTDTRNPNAPNFFLEAKGPDGSAAVKTRQACYDGAVGTRAMHALQNYKQAEPTYDNNAYTYSATYHDGTIKLYSHHLTEPPKPGQPPNYYMNQMWHMALTHSSESCREGIGAFRNTRDLAAEQRNMLIDQANAVAQSQSTDAMSFNTSSSQRTITSVREEWVGSDTSADELAPDHPSTTTNPKRHKKGLERDEAPAALPVQVQTQRTRYRKIWGRELVLEKQMFFIADKDWEPATLQGQGVLYNREKNIYTTVEPMKTFFLPSESISEAVIKAHIVRYCGSEATITSGSLKGRPGYRIRARSAPTVSDIFEMKIVTIQEAKRRPRRN